AIPWEVGQIQLHAYRIHSDARTANDFIDALRAWFMDRGEHWICGVFPDHWHVSEAEAQACIVRYISPHERAGFRARREDAAP
ncbi:MAG: hypothetical protein Q7T33_06185, partial [Dehalococcoidia bacterium]|nr:hypothetical protein [Dehalococcoidia bacterium]